MELVEAQLDREQHQKRQQRDPNNNNNDTAPSTSMEALSQDQLMHDAKIASAKAAASVINKLSSDALPPTPPNSDSSGEEITVWDRATSVCKSKGGKEKKVKKSIEILERFKDWRNKYLLFSGGKDSLVSLDLCYRAWGESFKVIYIEITGNTHPECTRYNNCLCKYYQNIE